MFGDTHNCCDEEIVVSSTTLEDKESHKMMKTNLRKSLAWDKAFFTNPGRFFFVCCVLWISYLFSSLVLLRYVVEIRCFGTG